MSPPSITGRSPRTRYEGDSQSPAVFLAACILIKRFALPIVAGFAVVSIISASYVGLNGNHVWRQSDVYSQILGMLGQAGLGPLDMFYGDPGIFDIPIYQAIVAGLSAITGGEPLLIVRIFGAVLFVITVFAGAKIAEAVEPGTGLVLAALLATSPLYLHYFATPLPDLLALTCSTVAVMLLLVSTGDGAPYWIALSLLTIGALIKAPVPFVFLAFYLTWTLTNRRSTLSGNTSWIRVGGLLMTPLLAAIGSELVRFRVNGAFDFGWYLGSPAERISPHTWEWAKAYTGEAFAFPWLAFAAAAALVLYLVLRRFEGFKLLLPLGVGFASGWLVFTPPYVTHDYYGLPTTFMLFMAVSIALRNLVGPVAQRVELLSKAGPILVVLAVPLMIVYGHKISSYSVTSEGEAMRFILRDVEHFVYVSNEDPEDWSPVVGGRAAKPFIPVSPGEFERSCMEILHHERAVVINRSDVEDASQCLSSIRESAVSFVKGPRYQVLSW